MTPPSIILMWPRIEEVGAIVGPGVGNLLGFDDEGFDDDGIDDGWVDDGFDDEGALVPCRRLVLPLEEG